MKRMNRLNRTMLAVAILAGSAAQAANLQLADNDAVLNAWAEAGGKPAAVVDDGEGGTRMQWHNGATLDAYRTEATGSALLTPKTTGDYHNLSVDSGFTRNGADGAVTEGTLGFSVVNDQSVASDDLHIGGLQLVRSNKDTRYAFGDVAASYSQLGVNLGLRGVQADHKFGDTTVSGAVGAVAESWETLAGTVDPTSLRRDVAALKVDAPAGVAGLRASVSIATHRDDDSSIPDGLSTPAAMDGHVATAGLAWTHERLVVNLEGGSSKWQQDGGVEGKDSAVVLDATWSGDKRSLRAGWHDIGAEYGSLSGAALGGVSEGYVAVSAQANDWLTLNGDVRHTENEPASNTKPPLTVQPAASADRAMLGAGISFEKWPGAALQLSVTGSDGENSDASKNRNNSGAVMLSYAKDVWNTNLGWQRSTVDNGSTSAQSANGDTDTLSAGIGRRWEELAGWAVDAALNGSSQAQSLDNGQNADSVSYTLSLACEHERLGRLDLSATQGEVTNPVDNSTLDQQSVQADYSHPVGSHGQLGLYWHDVADLQGNTGLESSDTTWGLKYSGSF
ncbi:MAG: hypothetical protein Q7V62_10770 [Actinomycetota bacterium]|nr:hypothetical protein [Actinomycetota bacterium]